VGLASNKSASTDFAVVKELTAVVWVAAGLASTPKIEAEGEEGVEGVMTVGGVVMEAIRGDEGL
jgi:hypothetical protein